MKLFVIQEIENPSLRWSNKYGWVDDAAYDVFTEMESLILRLPINGQWVEVT